MSRLVLLALLVVVAAPGAAHAETGPLPAPIVAECTPVAQAWYLPPGGVEPISGPELSVVDTDLRPGHTRLYLDGRFIGLADDFDGYPGYLYLEPGRYLLEARLGGYRTVVFALDAESSCAFDLRHKMERVPGTARVRWWHDPEEVAPGARVFGPVAAPAATPVVGAGPDLSLRPDLARPRVAEVRSGLRLTVTPPEAAVYLDGAFLGQARELNRRPRPVPVSVGPHQLEVMAPGHEPARRQLEVAADEVVEVVVALQPESSGTP